MGKKVIFLDMDGVINVCQGDKEYIEANYPDRKWYKASPLAIQRVIDICKQTGAHVVLNATMGDMVINEAEGREEPSNDELYYTDDGNIVNILRNAGVEVDGSAFNPGKDGANKLLSAARWLHEHDDIDVFLFIEDGIKHEFDSEYYDRYRGYIDDPELLSIFDSITFADVIDVDDNGKQFGLSDKDVETAVMKLNEKAVVKEERHMLSDGFVRFLESHKAQYDNIDALINDLIDKGHANYAGELLAISALPSNKIRVNNDELVFEMKSKEEYMGLLREMYGPKHQMMQCLKSYDGSFDDWKKAVDIIPNIPNVDAFFVNGHLSLENAKTLGNLIEKQAESLGLKFNEMDEYSASKSYDKTKLVKLASAEGITLEEAWKKSKQALDDLIKSVQALDLSNLDKNVMENEIEKHTEINENILNAKLGRGRVIKDAYKLDKDNMDAFESVTYIVSAPLFDKDGLVFKELENLENMEHFYSTEADGHTLGDLSPGYPLDNHVINRMMLDNAIIFVGCEPSKEFMSKVDDYREKFAGDDLLKETNCQIVYMDKIDFLEKIAEHHKGRTYDSDKSSFRDTADQLKLESYADAMAYMMYANSVKDDMIQHPGDIDYRLEHDENIKDMFFGSPNFATYCRGLANLTQERDTSISIDDATAYFEYADATTLAGAGNFDAIMSPQTIENMDINNDYGMPSMSFQKKCKVLTEHPEFVKKAVEAQYGLKGLKIEEVDKARDLLISVRADIDKSIQKLDELKVSPGIKEQSDKMKEERNQNKDQGDRV